jgi:endonuclease/exonuclease/phosphatase family metal-dependent hydrolase
MTPIVVLLVMNATVVTSTRGDREASCTARVDRIGTAHVQWIVGAQEDLPTLDRWCHGVGPPLYVPTPASVSPASPPPLEDLVVVTWNAHLAEGRLEELVARLREGAETDGRPAKHFVLLAQELFRRGDDVPAFGVQARTARAIRARDDEAPDARDYAARLGLSMLYVPSMRNGAKLLEDRGNAIFSTEPLSQALAFELPFERQRRVAIGAAIEVLRDGRRSTLRVVNTHLEALSSPRSLWVFRNPRTRQVNALFDFLSASRFEDDVSWVGTVVGGDFNTVQGGERESIYRIARRWSTGLLEEDRRPTHVLGRLDYLFFRLAPGIAAGPIRVADKFGSDHHPVLGRFTKIRE